MKKITLNLLVLLAVAFAWQSNAQTCDYVESGIYNGTDQAGAATPIDFSCVPAGNDVTNVVVNDFTHHYGSPTGSTSFCNNWYNWDISVNGSVVLTGACALDMEGFDYSAYAPISSIAFTINDLDNFNDQVYMDIDATLSYSPTPPPPPYLLSSFYQWTIQPHQHPLI